jgi:peptidoglycan hydrolase-like protein with peptidoglycan-binding domain
MVDLMIGLNLRACIVAISILFGMTAAISAQTLDQAWIQLEAHPDLTASEEGARFYAQLGENVAGFRLESGWYVVALGPFNRQDAQARLSILKTNRVIPRDAYVSDGSDYGQQFWPIGSVAAANVAPPPMDDANTQQIMTSAPIPDESIAQAQRSENDLSRSDRELLQTALAWYGFYEAKIDGSFGRGTRASMAAWQTSRGYEPTGVLTSLQRATLLDTYQADKSEFDFETITEIEAGIEIALPKAMVEFNRYEPPFVHFTEKDASGLSLILISEPGDAAALSGLYDILQSLDVMPSSGERSLDSTSFSITGANENIASYAFAQTSRGAIKGYMVTWAPNLSDKISRILPVLQASFRPAGDKFLDPGLVPLEEAARTGLLAGMRVKTPLRTASGIFVDREGSVLTNAASVDGCGRITLDTGAEAGIVATDFGVTLLRPLSLLSPTAIAPISTQIPRVGSPILAAGYSDKISLPAAVLSRGTLAAPTGLDGDENLITLAISLVTGDVGGPVLDETGALLGMITPTPDNKVLPQGVAVAVSVGVLAQILAANAISSPAVQTLPLTTDALTAAAMGMTTQVACWP